MCEPEAFMSLFLMESYIFINLHVPDAKVQIIFGKIASLSCEKEIRVAHFLYEEFFVIV